MRFALLGSHPDGLAMAAALIATGRHFLAAYTGTPPPTALPGFGEVRQANDLEEVLSDSHIDLVIVAGVEENRPAQLRRALQAERDVLCVHPPARSPEIAYEAAMLQKDTGYALLPLLPERLHPAVTRLKTLFQRSEKESEPRALLGWLLLLQMERGLGIEKDPLGTALTRKPTFPGWDVLRELGGEIAEVSAFAAREDVQPDDVVLVSGRFDRGGVFQLTLLPEGVQPGCRLVVQGSCGRAELFFPQEWFGPAFLTYRDEAGEPREEAWNNWDPWAALVSQVEFALAAKKVPALQLAAAIELPSFSQAPSKGTPLTPAARLSWEDAVRCLELDDAARRSIERRRSSVLEYQEASEEVGFKGTMTLAGCALLWGLLVLLIVLAMLPQILKTTQATLNRILPEGIGAATCVGLVFGLPLSLFLLLQLLRFVARKQSGGKGEK